MTTAEIEIVAIAMYESWARHSASRRASLADAMITTFLGRMAWHDLGASTRLYWRQEAQKMLVEASGA